MSELPDYWLRPSIPGLCPPGELLSPGYAYLIRSSVRITELYPILGDLVFGSEVVDRSTDELKTVQKGDTVFSGANFVGIVIDEEPLIMLQNLVGGADIEYKDFPTRDGGVLPRFAAWMNTFGRFDSASAGFENSHVQTGNGGPDDYDWYVRDLPGAGNPMGMFRFLRSALNRSADGFLSIYLMNSLSYCYRNLGLSDTAAFLKTVLSESVWKPGTAAADEAKNTVGGKDGILFALLQEGVMSEQEESYLESFFDGIVSVRPTKRDTGIRAATITVEVLPGIEQQQEAPLLYRPTERAGQVDQRLGDGLPSRYGVVFECPFDWIAQGTRNPQ